MYDEHTRLSLMMIANALADLGIEVELDACADPTTRGICKAIQSLGRDRDEWRSKSIVYRREVTKETYRRDCAEKDVAKLKALLEDKK